MNSTSDPTPVVERMREQDNWNPLWDKLHEWDPAWTEQFMATAMQPWLSGVLEPKVVELLAIAVDAAATHMYAPGVRRHIRMALRLGATREEILEVLKLTTLVGIHACNLGVPILAEELAQLPQHGDGA
ncbi:carboxymuconolactone decarboxylase family protein [Streptomyces sp. NPDC090052]|uniref:carboxymuconolactone decarboxylase family protein n=1 Tax=unclassified Streptomyces TaxID=2593676 RepID=UPI00225730AB|nr:MULTISPECIES: carboxymuconolactone decarboxylase family protein [unclassified Streptomyces]MCX4727694.1 carboxymuconolactone decarboxylase family protein [Streptomyces sp. NBC_01306]WSV03095.1 carboxymuconolactone decarboxylase family protein [Streptomyces sp. NBC_01020]WSX41123.1 carboxymuconolactone decarboxylase family protein [Streptomyces sp. NBC_00963]WSX70900.1 carboxymuconolactone decarboxylase family protein [Streptomyces sp. NBC_00932]